MVHLLSLCFGTTEEYSSRETANPTLEKAVVFHSDPESADFPENYSLLSPYKRRMILVVIEEIFQS